MSDLLFSYSGSELAPLLERLHKTHAETVASLDAKIAGFTEGQRQAAKAPGFGMLEYEQTRRRGELN